MGMRPARLPEFPAEEVAAVYTQERFLTGGVPDPKKVRPFVLSMPGNLF